MVYFHIETLHKIVKLQKLSTVSLKFNWYIYPYGLLSSSEESLVAQSMNGILKNC